MSEAADPPHSTDRGKAGEPGPQGDGEAVARQARQESNHPAPGEGGTVDRDALHQADYGGARGPAEDQQGGVASDDAAGDGGRKPTGERDRDYDPDGDRTGL